MNKHEDFGLFDTYSIHLTLGRSRSGILYNNSQSYTRIDCRVFSAPHLPNAMFRSDRKRLLSVNGIIMYFNINFQERHRIYF